MERAPAHHGRERGDHVHPVPQTLLLVERPAAAALQRAGGQDRHRDPRLDRTAGARARAAARGRRQARPHRRGARRRPGPHRTPARGVPGEPVRRCDAAVRRARVPAASGRSLRERADRRHLRPYPDGPWEIVDWKTGQRPSSQDPSAGLQLDIYGLAAAEIWGKAAGDITLTYYYLASGEEVTRPMDDPGLVRERVLALARGDRRGCVRSHTRAHGAGTATSGASVTRARPGLRLRTDAYSSLSIDSSNRPISGRRVEPTFGHTGHQARDHARPPRARGPARHARNHSRSPGWIWTSPCMPKRR